jgi:chemotaxis protein CheD
MTIISVNISEYKVCADQDSVLVTYALGSCVAVLVHDPVQHVGGMIHYMLPTSKASPEKAARKPAMFCDTGVPLMFKEMYSLGCQKKDMVVKVVGGAQPLTADFNLQIGRRNYLTLRQLFWKNGILISAEDVGGTLSRTARLYIKTGEVYIRSGGGERPL